jgi:L-threonylcarbamoyladenylate synthase
VIRSPNPLPLRRHLALGGLIAYPTESCFGLGCDPRNPRAVATLLRLKGRPRAKGLILVASDLTQLRPYVAPLTPALRDAAVQYWPGPVTLLLPASARCPRWLTGHRAKLAVRVSAHPDTRAVCHAAGMALVSTSANRAGMKPIRSRRECMLQFGHAVRVLSGRVGARRRPSTILDPLTHQTLRP